MSFIESIEEARALCGKSNGVRILSLDDDAPILSILQEILTREGYECLGTTHEREALQILRTGIVDLFTQDIARPGGMGGCEFLKLMKTDPSLRPILVLVISAFPCERVAEMFREMGIDLVKDVGGFLEKPFDVNELTAKVRALTALLQRRSFELNKDKPASPSK